MGARELVAVVDQVTAIEDIGGEDVRRPALVESPPHREVEGGVGGQMGRPVLIEGTRPVSNVAVQPRLARQGDIESEVGRLALVVVEEVVAALGRWLEVRQPAADCPLGLNVLMGPDQPHLGAIQQAQLAQRRIPAANARPLQGDGQKDAGIAEHVVVEVVARRGPEVADFDRPAARRYRQAELVLFVALALQRNIREAL